MQSNSNITRSILPEEKSGYIEFRLYQNKPISAENHWNLLKYSIDLDCYELISDITCNKPSNCWPERNNRNSGFDRKISEYLSTVKLIPIESKVFSDQFSVISIPLILIAIAIYHPRVKCLDIWLIIVLQFVIEDEICLYQNIEWIARAIC